MIYNYIQYNTRRLIMLRKSDKKGFTLTEMLIAIGVIGVIAAITIPILLKNIPSQKESTKKKADYLVEQIVNQLYDDDIMYPKTKELTVGFQNTEKATILDPASHKLVDYEGDTKFCKLFASRMVLASGSKIVCENERSEDTSHLARGKKSFTAKDGIEWYLPVTSFAQGAAEIMVDVNGPDGKNCVEDEKYKDALGLEHTCTAKDADRFIYYVKTNGTISLKKPTNVQKNSFQINVKVTSEGCSEDSCSHNGGSVQIAALGTNTKDDGATYSSSSADFKNLSPNTRYMLKAIPNAGYYTNWSLNKKRVTVYSGDVDVELKFYKRKTFCVTLDIDNCNEDNATDCVEAKLLQNCQYTKTTAKNGEYKLNSDGVYEYVGLGVDEGMYKYTCGSAVTAEAGVRSVGTGRPVIDSSTGKYTIDTTKSSSSIHWCGLHANDYKITATGKGAYKVKPYTECEAGDVDCDPNADNGDYQQEVRLGTESLFFNTSVDKYK